MMNILSYSLMALPGHSAFGNSVNYVLLALLILTVMNSLWLLRKLSFIEQKSDFCLNVIQRANNSLMITKSSLEDLAADNLPSLASTEIKRIAGQMDDIIYSNTSALSIYAREEDDNFQTREYELHTYIASLTHRWREHVENSRVKLNVCKDAGYRGCHINEMAFTAALQGLMERSIDNTPPDGSVNVILSCQDDRWGLEISNCPPEKPYKRCLGRLLTSLKVCCCGNFRFMWDVVGLHGGKIAGYELGKSVHYKITVPMADDDRADNAPMEEASAIGRLPHVLLVTEDTKFSGYLKAILSPAYRISVCGNYEEISMSVTNWNTDVIIIDEATEGSALCSKIKSNKRTSEVMVLLLTASGDGADREELGKCDADRLLPRMVHTERLKAEIHALVEERKQKLERVRRLINTDFSADVPQDLLLSKEDMTIMRKVNGLLEQHLSDRDYNKEKLAGDMAVCGTKLYYMIRRITQISIISYIIYFRMERTKELLLTRQYTVGEVASKVGYTDGSYLGKVFKKYYDLSPKEYMEKYGKQSESC